MDTTTISTPSTSRPGKYADRPYLEGYRVDSERLSSIYRAQVAAIYGVDISPDDSRYTIPAGEFVAVRVKDDGSLPGRKWMTGETAETWAVLCSEGVGWVADAYGIIALEHVSGFGYTSRVMISVPHLVELLDLEHPVDVAEFVNTFGDRLEANFRLWLGHASR